jgi:hypothetical protein
MDFGRSALGYYTGRLKNRSVGKVQNIRRQLGNKLALGIAGPTRKFASTWTADDAAKYEQLQQIIAKTTEQLNRVKTSYSTILMILRQTKLQLRNLQRKKNSNTRLTGIANIAMARRNMNTQTVNGNTTTQTVNGNTGRRNMNTQTVNGNTGPMNNRLTNNQRKRGLMNQFNKYSVPNLVRALQHLKSNKTM